MTTSFKIRKFFVITTKNSLLNTLSKQVLLKTLNSISTSEHHIKFTTCSSRLKDVYLRKFMIQGFERSTWATVNLVAVSKIIIAVVSPINVA